MLEKLKAGFSNFISKLKSKAEAEEVKEKIEEKKEENEEVKQEKEIKEKKESIELTTKTKIRALLTNKIKISKEDFEKFWDELEFKLIEANVALEAVEDIKKELEDSLIEKEFDKKDFEKQVKEEIKKSLLKYLEKSFSNFDIIDFCKKNQKPVKILFLGPNGAGKTTTIAKIAKILKENNLKCVFAASDTFRAAAIEQFELHAKNLGVKVIKHQYGSDPASVAFDAVEHAKANSIDVVLIDTAGRQETNKNLIEEMKKISRVVKPDLKIFVVESIAGNSLIEQIREFKKHIGIDGIIITKLDCDDKGGAVLGISKLTDTPIYYISFGQEYEKIEKYEPAKFLERILS
jgi:fused signal recognition particle receptor